MTPSVARFVIIASGLVGVTVHAALTILVTLGLSLGRQSDDPWTAPAEILVAVAFFGSLGVLALIAALAYRMRPGLLQAYAAAWVIVSGSLVATVAIEFGWQAVTIRLVIASPIIALASVGACYWALRSIPPG